MRFVANQFSRSEQASAGRRYLMPMGVLRACLVLLSVFLFAADVAADTPAASNYAGGNGTQQDPFQISTLAELRKFMESAPLFPSQAYYKLTATIDAADTSTWLGGLGWAPVNADLMDDFDGQNFEIQNLYINRPTEDGVGLFKQAGGGCCQQLKNIRIVGGQITGRDQVGGLIGSLNSFATLSNSVSTATISGRGSVGGLVGQSGNTSITGSSAGGAVTGGADFVGGLVGGALGTSISSSHATGHVIGKRQVGGLLGEFVQGGSATPLTLSWATGQVDGDDKVGGLIGEATGKVTFSHATGAVTATGVNPITPGYAMVGGLIGSQGNYPTEDSWASGAVQGPLKGIGGLIGINVGPVLRSSTVAGQTVTGTVGSANVGGLVGENQGSITASRAAGTVNVAGAATTVGGLVGLHAGANSSITISTSYATGNVTATGATKVGGLVGWQVTGSVVNCHADGNVSGSQDVGGLVGFSAGSAPAVNGSHATGTVSGQTTVGGLIGNKPGGTVDSSFATGAVTGTGDYVGGLIGLSTGAVTKSYAKTGTVSGQQWVGGLVGLNQKTIATSYATNNVNGTVYVGGLVGQGAEATGLGLSDCYAKGAVAGTDKVGGLVGRNESTSNVTRCYASGTVSGNAALLSGNDAVGAVVAAIGGLIGDNARTNNSNNYWNATTAGVPGIGTGSTVGATGLTSVQMKQQASFTGFVFPSPWQITEGVTEPFLDWAAVAVTSTTTGLVSSANPSASGQSVTFTATVTGNAPTGNVLFQDGATPLNGCIAVPVTLAANQAQCTISSLALGSHGISAVYSGDNLNTGSVSPTLNQNVLPPSLDVDASIAGSKYDALTDGLLIIRYLHDLAGNSLVTGALGPTATRADAPAIKAYLDFISPLLDIDGNGGAEPFTDGVLIMRYLFGLRGDALIAGVPLATGKTAEDIETYIKTLLP